MTNVSRAQLLWLWWECQKGIDLTFRKQFLGVGTRNPIYILVRIQSHMCGHNRHIQVTARGLRLYPDPTTLQVADLMDWPVGEQLITADVQTSKHRNRQAAIEVINNRARKSAGEIYPSAGHQLGECKAPRRIDVLYIRKSLHAQQLVRYIEGCKTDSGAFRQSDSGGFG